MSEHTGKAFCNTCGKETEHLLSGSEKKGWCEVCDTPYRRDIKAELISSGTTRHSKVTAHYYLDDSTSVVVECGEGGIEIKKVDLGVTDAAVKTISWKEVLSMFAEDKSRDAWLEEVSHA